MKTGSNDAIQMIAPTRKSKYSQNLDHEQYVDIPCCSPGQPPEWASHVEMVHPHYRPYMAPAYADLRAINDRKEALPVDDHQGHHRLAGRLLDGTRAMQAKEDAFEAAVLSRWAEESTLEHQEKHEEDAYKRYLSKWEAWEY